MKKLGTITVLINKRQLHSHRSLAIVTVLCAVQWMRHELRLFLNCLADSTFCVISSILLGSIDERALM